LQKRASRVQTTEEKSIRGGPKGEKPRPLNSKYSNATRQALFLKQAKSIQKEKDSGRRGVKIGKKAGIPKRNWN